MCRKVMNDSAISIYQDCSPLLCWGKGSQSRDPRDKQDLNHSTIPNRYAEIHSHRNAQCNGSHEKLILESEQEKLVERNHIEKSIEWDGSDIGDGVQHMLKSDVTFYRNNIHSNGLGLGNFDNDTSSFEQDLSADEYILDRFPDINMEEEDVPKFPISLHLLEDTYSVEPGDVVYATIDDVPRPNGYNSRIYSGSEGLSDSDWLSDSQQSQSYSEGQLYSGSQTYSEPKQWRKPVSQHWNESEFVNNDLYASIDEDGSVQPNVQRLSQEYNVQRYSRDLDSSVMSLGNAVCSRCDQGFEPEEEMVNSDGEIWHTRCFVCAQCFQPFPGGVFYEFEGRKYCEHDFRVLFAPCCGRCGEFINGRVIKALNSNWHPHCFQCQICQITLADSGFMKNKGRALCRDCNAKEKALGMGKYICHKCHSVIDEGHIKFKGEAYHPYHFNCHSCEGELTDAAREKGGELYCLRCHDKMGIPICGACRRPIEERVVHALGKTWHVEHFVCAKCEKPFLGHRHYEKKGLAYCETHYHQLFGNICFVCNQVIAGDVFSALNKAWCVNHFACSTCDRKMSQKSKFFEFDLKPVCKNCYERFPSELKKRQKKAYEQSPKK